MPRGSTTRASTWRAARAASATTRSSTSSVIPRRRRRPTGSCGPRTARSSNDFVSDAEFAELPRGLVRERRPRPAPGRRLLHLGRLRQRRQLPARPRKAPASTSARRSSGTRSTRSSRARTSWATTSGASTAGRKAPPTASSGRPTCTDLWHVKKVSPNAMVHLTEKPVELARRAIEYSLAPGRGGARPLRGLGLDAHRRRADRAARVPHGGRPALLRRHRRALAAFTGREPTRV